MSRTAPAPRSKRTRIIGALVLGIAGIAILLNLGFWQVRRLAWKEGILSEIESKISAAPVALPADPDPEADEYLSVQADGAIGSGEIRVLASRKEIGPGYRIIAPFTTDNGRRVLLDRGFVPEAQKDQPRPGGPAHVVGNLHWPNEIDSFTPAPDPKADLWFARDVPAMAKALDTEPVMIVARQPAGEGVTPLPVGTEGIPNDHLQYAITWFSLAIVWAGMTLLLLWRISRRTG